MTSSWGIGGEIETEVALVVVHIRVLNCPAVMVEGDADSVAEGVAPGVGVGVGVGIGVGVGVGLVEAPVPEQPATKMPMKRTAKTAMAKREIVRTWVYLPYLSWPLIFLTEWF